MLSVVEFCIVVVVPCGFHLSALVVGATFVVVHCAQAPATKPMVRIDGQWRYGSGDISQLLRAERIIASGKFSMLDGKDPDEPGRIFSTINSFVIPSLSVLPLYAKFSFVR